MTQAAYCRFFLAYDPPDVPYDMLSVGECLDIASIWPIGRQQSLSDNESVSPFEIVNLSECESAAALKGLPSSFGGDDDKDENWTNVDALPLFDTPTDKLDFCTDVLLF